MFNVKEYKKIYYIKNKEKMSKKANLYYVKHKEEIKRKVKNWKKDNPEKVRKWRELNRAYLLKYNEEYHKDNRKKVLKRQRKFYQDNHKKMLEYFKQWRKNNSEYIKKWRYDNKEYHNVYQIKWRKTEKGKANQQRGSTKRRAKIKDIINTLTSQEWLDILEKYNYRCAYCGVEFNCELLPEKDHVIPISKGGHNVKENVVPACRSCNAKKYNKILKGVGNFDANRPRIYR